jgi:pyruvate-formate lyase-activating enzyme
MEESAILIKGLVDEDFVQYKNPSMFIGTCFCDWKCCKDVGRPVTMCQNSPLANSKSKAVKFSTLYNRYINNPITKAIVFGGLEPMLQFESVMELIKYFRQKGCKDDFVIYTGYYEDELQEKIKFIESFVKEYDGKIIVKFGRFVPNQEPRWNRILGVELASPNQYAKEYQ